MEDELRLTRFANMETSWSLHVGDVQVRELNRLQCFSPQEKTNTRYRRGRDILAGSFATL